VNTKAHILVSIVSITSLLFILRLVRRRQLRAKYALLWLSVGIVFVVLGVSPLLLDKVAKRVGIDYPPALLFLVGIIFLLLVVVHLTWEVSRLEERTRLLAEEMALLRTEVSALPSGTVEPLVVAPQPPAATSRTGSAADLR